MSYLLLLLLLLCSLLIYLLQYHFYIHIYIRCALHFKLPTHSYRRIAQALASNASNNKDEDFIDLTFPKMKRIFLDFTTDQYSGVLVSGMKGSSRTSKNSSKDSLVSSVRAPATGRTRGGNSSSSNDGAGDDGMSIEGSERDDAVDENDDTSDSGDGKLKGRDKVAVCGHFRGVLIKCQDEAALASQIFTSTRNGLRSTVCKTEIVPQLTVVDFGPKTSRVGIDYQVGVV